MKLILINQAQFGYHIDTYYYCKYLKEEYSIVYLSWDHDLPKIEMEGVKVVYISRKGNMVIRILRFLWQALGLTSDNRTIVFIKYFQGVSLILRLIRPTHHIVLDIRTGSVHKKQIVRRFYDAQMKFETWFFSHITVISQSLAEKLKIVHKAHILSLGADVISSTQKTFESLHLLYVGTLFNRNIENTIHGLKQFYDTFKDQIPISYTIIGDGPTNEAQSLRELVSAYGLSNIVRVMGRILHTDLGPYFDTCNIGVSYIPLTDYYDCQPVTKTFEYLLSGIPVLATCTSENRKIIYPENGVLIGDMAQDFSLGLKAIFEKKHLFDSEKIRSTAMDYTWENIVKKNLKGYLENMYRHKC